MGVFMDFNTVIKKRRSHYNLTSSKSIDRDEIITRLKIALLHAPSAFNAQSTKIALLLDHHHITLWKKLLDDLRLTQSEKRYQRSKARIEGFIKAYGTILFFEDREKILSLKEKYPKIEHEIDVWAHQSQGMLQYAVWLSLAEVNVGASLQHENKGLSPIVQSMLKVPSSWELIAQMPFGEVSVSPKEKHFEDVNHRFKVFD